MHNSLYLQVDGVTGEAKDSRHKGWIDVQTFRWQLRQPTEAGVGGGGGCGRLVVRDLEVFARMDKAMPTLMTLGAEGKRLKTVSVVMCKAGSEQDEYLHIILKTVMLSGIEIGTHSGDDGIDGGALSKGDIGVIYRFSPSLVEVNYHEQDENGSPGPQVTFNWDVKGNTQ
ncbi:type VI secretion system tube protein Hcp [Sodalis ligni]|uniref:Hcp family type VI secretion system effector n=1 Tax=Sodalis ligni TaxID=2697027 RepID=UPI00193F2F2A|nr:type VI secretion system tube protein Hcp [Sodalis ligni]QWA11546.1 type VI secretion system tube protein Hcp [Sodalis ligni]